MTGPSFPIALDTVYNAVHAQQLPVTVTTYWRALRPLQDGLQITLFFSREDGAVVYHYEGPAAAELWFPPSRWQEGEVIRIETPILSAGRLRDVMVAVTPPGKDLWSAEDRLAVDAGDAPLALWMHERRLRVVEEARIVEELASRFVRDDALPLRQARAQARRFLAAAHGRIGILVEGSPGLYNFSHQGSGSTRGAARPCSLRWNRSGDPAGSEPGSGVRIVRCFL